LIVLDLILNETTASQEGGNFYLEIFLDERVNCFYDLL